MNELQTIREALEMANMNLIYIPDPLDEKQKKVDKALSALAILEASEAEMPDTAKLIERIRRGINPNGKGLPLSSAECGAAIGQYAYRYSEDIRKDRDYWKSIAQAFHDAVHKHIKNHTPIKSECQGCEGQGLDCAESCLRPKK